MLGHGGPRHARPAGRHVERRQALAICDSYRELERIDVGDIRKKFLAWYNDDAFTCDRLFDIGHHPRAPHVDGGVRCAWFMLPASLSPAGRRAKSPPREVPAARSRRRAYRREQA